MNAGTRMLLAFICLSLGTTEAMAFEFGLGESKFTKEVETEKPAVKLARETVAGGYGLISTEELNTLLNSEEGKQVLLIDTMPYADSYKKEHIPGAKHFLFPIPAMTEWDTKETDGKTEADYAALLGPDKNKTIICYCGFVKCTRSHNAAVWAKKLGYSKVLRHPGGIFAWKGASYLTEAVQ